MSKSVFLNAGYGGAALSDGQAATTANTGASAVNSLAGSTNTWKADTSFGGAWAVESINGTGVASIRLPFASGTYQAGISWTFTCPTLPPDSSPYTLTTLRTPSGALVLVQLSQAGQVNIQAGAAKGSLPAPKTPAGATPAALVPGVAYRLEVMASGNSASVGTGTVSARVYAQGADVADYLLGTSGTVSDLGTAQIVAADVGLIFTGTPRTMRHSNALLDDAATTWQGPFDVSVPAFDFTHVPSPQAGAKPLNVTLTVARMSGTGAGTTSSFTVDWGDGAASAPQSVPGTTPVTFTHTYSPTVATDFTYAVTGNLS